MVVGHDIGLMVAYAYAAQFPAETEKLVLMDAFLPGVEGWEAIYNNPAIWHFRFNGPTPEALVAGTRAHLLRAFLERLRRRQDAVDSRGRSPGLRGRVRAARTHASGWAYFVSFPQAAKDFAQLSQTKLTMPVLSIGGDKANGEALRQQVKLVATNASSVVLPNTGHWIMEESPQETTDALMRFLGSPSAAASRASPRPSSTLPEMRLTPAEVRADQTGSSQVGSSGLPGVSTQVLFGDPSKPGFYTIVLFVPAHTTIQAHSHRDDRMATVVSGTWQFGYGDHFDAGVLKTLPPGSVYSEPAGVNHFARTDAEPVFVQISGFGPTDTR